MIAVLALMLAVALIVAGVSMFSVAAALIVAGALLLIITVGYLRGSSLMRGPV